jgi:hypothetical protein
MDILEANKYETEYPPHIYAANEEYRCDGSECVDADSRNRYGGVFDKD